MEKKKSNDHSTSTAKNTSANSSETHEVTKMKRDIITLKAEIKAWKDKIEQNDEKINGIRKIL